MKLKCYSVGDVDTRSSAADSTGVRPRMNRLYQTSTMAALLDAVYDGETTLDELLMHGNFGLGTFNGLDGEMIVNDSVIHQFRADGQAGRVPGDLKTPFACVTFFNPEKEYMIDTAQDKEGFEAIVDHLVNNPNLFAAVRFTGMFERVETRTVFCQCQPYPPCWKWWPASRPCSLAPRPAPCSASARRATCRVSTWQATTCTS